MLILVSWITLYSKLGQNKKHLTAPFVFIRFLYQERSKNFEKRTNFSGFAAVAWSFLQDLQQVLLWYQILFYDASGIPVQCGPCELSTRELRPRKDVLGFSLVSY